MVWITFVKPFTFDEEEGDGPHYVKGYQCDLTPAEANKWVRDGYAELGRIDCKSDNEVEPELNAFESYSFSTVIESEE